MSTRPEAQGAMTRATQEVVRLIPKAHGSMVVLVVGEELVEACRAGNLDEPDIHLSINDSLTGLSFLSGSAFRCDDAEMSPFVDHGTTTRLGVGSFVSVPLRDGIRAIGALIAASRDRSAFTEADVEVLTSEAQSLENELVPHAGRVRRLREQMRVR